jgi:ribosomal protein S18 acetylase RimI-like enzyme
VAPEIHSAGSEELLEILSFWRRATEVASSTDDLEALTLLARRDPEALLVAVDDGAIVGTVIATWDGWRGAFYRLAVDPEQRGRGIGRALVAEGEARMRRRGCRRVSLYAMTEHAGAVAFWKAVGYQPDPDETRFAANLGSAGAS